MKDWRVYSSADMVNWTDHGSPMSLATFSWASADAWAGQAVYRNGKFYWYVPVTNRATGRMAIGVGVSDSPTGPFRDALGRPLVENGEIDPTVFIDDDGQAYLYWGNPNLWYVRLNADMISYSGGADPDPADHRRLRHPHRQRRAARRCTRRDPGSTSATACTTTCSRRSAARSSSRYSTAPGPTGPWTYRGTVMPTQGGSFTNHAGVIDFNGGSYFFYHNGALPGGGGFTRSVAVEKFTYNADGTIPTINMTTAGAPQVGTLNPYVRQEAETIAWAVRRRDRTVQRGRHERRLDRERRLHQGQGRRLRRRRDVVHRPGRLGDQRRPHRAAPGQRQRHRSWAPAPSPGTGGWQTWTTVTCPVSGATGTHDLYLRFAGGSGNLFNVNWWQFSAGQSAFSSTA